MTSDHVTQESVTEAANKRRRVLEEELEADRARKAAGKKKPKAFF